VRHRTHARPAPSAISAGGAAALVRSPINRRAPLGFRPRTWVSFEPGNSAAGRRGCPLTRVERPRLGSGRLRSYGQQGIAAARRRHSSSSRAGASRGRNPVLRAALGQVPYDADEDRVQCHLCGGWYRAIGSMHLIKCHGWRLDQYRQAFGLLASRSCAVGVSRKLSRHTSGRIAAGEFSPGGSYRRPERTPGRGVRPSESLAAVHPELVAKLDPELNVGVDPFKLGPRSGKKLWWRCPDCQHAWAAAPHDRTRGNGCPVCAIARRAESNRCVRYQRSLAAKHPDLVGQLHPTLNADLDPGTLAAGSGRKVWWHCHECGCDWEAAPASRVRGHGCPALSTQVWTQRRSPHTQTGRSGGSAPLATTSGPPPRTPATASDDAQHVGVTSAHVSPRRIANRQQAASPALRNRGDRFPNHATARSAGAGCPFDSWQRPRRLPPMGELGSAPRRRQAGPGPALRRSAHRPLAAVRRSAQSHPSGFERRRPPQRGGRCNEQRCRGWVVTRRFPRPAMGRAGRVRLPHRMEGSSADASRQAPAGTSRLPVRGMVNGYSLCGGCSPS
jgi:hypothetical protein